jgi:hypothetical protein
MLVGFLLAVMPVFGAEEGAFRWPLDLAPQLTSSFAEYRPGRLHAGIDLRTNGIGRDVFAASDGYVSRVVCSPGGYGKAIYLALEGGYTAVYAHLDDYYPELATYVRAAQHRAKDYSVNLYPKRDQFRVARGQFIAKSGQTGIGAPHLHYELRDGSQQPINPRALGITWPDTTRPQLHQLAVLPRGPGDRIEGDYKPRVVKVPYQGGGRYTANPIHVDGAVGFGLELVDPGAGGYRLGVHRLRLLQDDTEVFRVQHDLISYESNHHGSVIYHPLLEEKGRFLLLYRWPGNDSKSYQHGPDAGWVEVDKDDAEVTIEVTDFQGNTSVLTIPLVGAAPDDIPVPPKGDMGTGSIDVDCVGTHMLVTARFTGPETKTPTCFLEHESGVTEVSFIRVGTRTFRATVAPTTPGLYQLRVAHPRMTEEETAFHVFAAGETAPQVTLDDLELRVQPNSAFGKLFARVQKAPSPTSAPLETLGAAYEIWPTEVPIDDHVEIRFPVPEGIENPRRVHVYRQRTNGWEVYSTTWTDHRLIISTRSFGKFVIMEDTKAPVIREVLPGNGKAFTTRRPQIRATVTDVGSGIDRIEVLCGEQWLLTGYDPERKQIDWAQDEDLPSGRQEIVITVTDNAGNATTVTRSVTIPG